MTYSFVFCLKMCLRLVFAFVIHFFPSSCYCCLPANAAQSARFYLKIVAQAVGAVSARFREEHFARCIRDMVSIIIGFYIIP
jgi:hypothetical protein